MNDPDPAVVENDETEPGVQPTDDPKPVPDDEPDGNQDTDQDTDGDDAPSSGEDNADNEPDDAEARKAKAIEKLAFENRQLKRELEEERAKAEAVDEEPEPLKTLADFDGDEQAFNEYLVEETSTRTAKKLAKDQAKASEDAEAQREQDAFDAREDAFEAENPGFKKRMRAADLTITPAMAVMIRDPDSEAGFHVGDYLSKNKEEAAKIARLPLAAQIREMAKLEDRIGGELAKAKAEKSKTSNAPDPPSDSLDGDDPGIGDVDPTDPKSDDLDDDEWVRRRNKQLEAKRKR